MKPHPRTLTATQWGLLLVICMLLSAALNGVVAALGTSPGLSPGGYWQRVWFGAAAGAVAVPLLIWWVRWRLQRRESGLPEGWTDDMTIPLPPGRTSAEVVEFILQTALSGTRIEQTVEQVAAEFTLSEDDASLAADRTFGGLVRASTKHPANCPDKIKDPLAWESFQRCTRDPSLITRLRPKLDTETGPTSTQR